MEDKNTGSRPAEEKSCSQEEPVEENMDIAFENRFSLTKDLAREYVTRVLVNRVMIGGGILAVLGLVGTVRASSPTRYIFLLLTFLGLFAAIMTPIISLRQIQKNATEGAGGAIEEIHTTFGDRIEVAEGGRSRVLPYASVRKLKETRNLFVLTLPGHGAILVKKDAFLQGEAQNFKAFIEGELAKSQA